MKFFDFFDSNPEITHLISVVIILVFTFGFVRLIRLFFDKVFDESDVAPNDKTRLSFIKNGISFIIWIVAFAWIIYTIPKLRQMAVTIFAGAGIFVAVLGIASQQAFSNIVSGIFLVVFKPFRVGDLVKIGSFDYGTVEEITLRHTVIRDFKNKRIIFPNSTVANETIINDTIIDSKACRHLIMGISYDSDIDLAMKIMIDEAKKHPFCIDVRTKDEIKNKVPQIPVRVVSFGDSSVNLRANIWADSAPLAFQMECDLLKSIKERFDKEGIEIPFPYRTIVYKNKDNSNSTEA
jgi:small conductance mechanosensitive channel